jgi:hypothetical protein
MSVCSDFFPFISSRIFTYVIMHSDSKSFEYKFVLILKKTFWAEFCIRTRKIYTYSTFPFGHAAVVSCFAVRIPLLYFVTVLTVKILWSTIFFSRTWKYLIRFLLWCSYWLFFRVRMQNSAQNVFLSMSTNLYSKLFESECIIT